MPCNRPTGRHSRLSGSPRPACLRRKAARARRSSRTALSLGEQGERARAQGRLRPSGSPVAARSTGRERREVFEKAVHPVPRAMAMSLVSPSAPGRALAPPRSEGLSASGRRRRDGAGERNRSGRSGGQRDRPFRVGQRQAGAGRFRQAAHRRPRRDRRNRRLAASHRTGRSPCFTRSYQDSPFFPRSPAAATISHFSARVSAT